MQCNPINQHLIDKRDFLDSPPLGPLERLSSEAGSALPGVARADAVLALGNAAFSEAGTALGVQAAERKYCFVNVWYTRAGVFNC